MEETKSENADGFHYGTIAYMNDLHHDDMKDSKEWSMKGCTKIKDDWSGWKSVKRMIHDDVGLMGGKTYRWECGKW